MEIREIADKKQIDDFLLAQSLKSGSFLQSYLWGEFQKKFGLKIWRLGISNQDNLKGTALLIRHNLPFGKSYLYCPKGPVFEDGWRSAGGESSGRRKTESEMFKLLFKKVKKIAQEENSIFFRFEPPVAQKQFYNLKDNLGLKKTQTVQPQTTWVLSLKASEEEILSNMKQKTRYNIHLAERKNVQIRTSSSPKEVEQFFLLAQETASRNKIKTHPKSYYYKMVESFSKNNLVKLYIAEYKNRILAVNLMLSFGKTVTYLHGGSSSDYRNVMAPYLLHWRAIRDAKNEGKTFYDFGGVSPEGDSAHKWAGISRFKRGFGGQEVNSAGTYDKVLNSSWYWVYRIVRKIRN